jgi:hypothetical protein
MWGPRIRNDRRVCKTRRLQEENRERQKIVFYNGVQSGGISSSKFFLFLFIYSYFLFRQSNYVDEKGGEKNRSDIESFVL